MRRSLVYLSIAGLLATVSIVITASLNGCEPGRYCLFVPQVNTAVQSAPVPTQTPAVETSSPSPSSTTTPATLDATVTPTQPTQTPGVTTEPAPAVTTTSAASEPTGTATAATTTPTVKIKGLAILGDSIQDEYQADNPRGGDFTATTFNWVEQLVRFRSVNVGAPGTRPEPRRSGYEYNWARSGDGSDGMIAKGQHTGAAAQIVAGDVSHVAIQIGVNDFYFSGLGTDIYLGTISDATLKARLNYIVANITLAAKTVHAAHPKGVLLVALQDYVTVPIMPELRTAFIIPAGKQRVLAAFAYVNDELKKFAAQEGIPFFDYNAAMLAEINSRLDTDGYLVISGQRVNLNQRGNDPHFGILDDGYAHPGTVLSSLSANVYIRAFNREFGTNIATFSDAEILQIAGMVK